jgi:eukaryotic-like serine/threonine-protein kinase
MPLEDRLAAALADRYTIERELGRGGMATVYLARDARHQRYVAVKVLRPELATVVGWERFLTEIRLTARLQHPHILTLIDSGDTGEYLWYAVPYIRGESLRVRLLRERQLPIPDALRLARQIGSALAFAHHQGVIHRDVKPENILLHESEAVLADFGIARALADAGGERLTQSGHSLGTPQYMSPEQATGDPQIGARSDQYSLAAVVYEMLAGEPPFSGPTAQAIIAKLLVERPVALRTLRETASKALESVIMRALSKSPADRFDSVEEFSAALDRVAVEPANGAAGVVAVRWEPTSHARRNGLVFAGLMVALVGAALLFRDPGAPSGSPAPASPLVVVVPFRIAGADSSLRYLAEGIIDLLSARLAGSHGLRMVDPYAAVSAWRQEVRAGDSSEVAALRLATGFHAAFLITGSVAGTAERVSLQASIRQVGDGRLRGSASSAGLADSVLGVVDHLAAQLLVRREERDAGRLPSLSGVPLSAVRDYLEGRAAYRRGEYRAAVTALEEALQVDSGFSVAALDQILAASVLPDAAAYDRAKRLAWAAQEGLTPVDRMVLRAFAGPDYPQHPTGIGRLLRFDSAATMAPDRPDLWFMLGDALYHEGPALGIEDQKLRAAAAFERALALDPAYEAPLEHLVELAASAGQIERMRRLGSQFLSLHPESERADYLRWRMAVAMGDEAALPALRARFDSMSPASLSRIVGVAQLDGVALDDAERALAAYLRQSSSLAERRDFWIGAKRSQLVLSRNLGRNREATQLLEAMYGEDTRQPSTSAHIAAAMAGAGPSGPAELEAQSLLRTLDSVGRARRGSLGEGAVNFCLAARWAMSRRDRAGAERAFLVLARSLRDSAAAHAESEMTVCLAGLQARLALGKGDPSAPRMVARFDSMAAARIWAGGGYRAFVNLDVAELQEAAGNLPGALRAIRRRAYNWIPDELIGLPLYLRTEGSLAARTGDTAGAIRAYRHYLALRSQPDPELVPERDSVRAAVQRLSTPQP